MRKLLSVTLALGTACLAACDSGTDTTTTNDSTATVVTNETSGSTDQTITMSANPPLSETDTYLDLKTGKTFKVRKDSQSGIYVGENMEPLDIYVNTNTRDTFSGPEGLLVNNALIFSNGAYTVDELKVKRNGEGYKAKSEDGEYKEKSNENEYKLKDGSVKVKANENEYKYKDKDAGVKVKSNENETKIKTPDEKIKIDDEGNVERKPR